MCLGWKRCLQVDNISKITFIETQLGNMNIITFKLLTWKLAMPGCLYDQSIFNVDVSKLIAMFPSKLRCFQVNFYRNIGP